MTTPGALGRRFQPPQPTRAVLVRPRLLSVLGGRWERRVTVVVAGPGFGKSTLLAQAVAENRLDPAGEDVWVSCDPSDGAASVLSEALCQALGAPAPGPGSTAQLAAAIADAVLTRAPVPVTFVLDDVHLIPEGSEGAQLLVDLVTHLPPAAHLVLGARRKPPIPLARLIAQGAAVRLVEEDLAFTADELEAFAALRQVPRERLERVGTWPAIAELMAGAGPEVVREYLWGETLAEMAEPRRRHLALLMAVGGGDAATLGAAAGEPVDLDDLIDGVPLVSRTKDGWVDIHDLWSAELSGSLPQDEREEAQRMTARHLLERGERLRAFRLFTQAGAWDDAAAMVLEACSHLYVPVATDVLAGRLHALDGHEGPEVLLLRGVLSAERETGLRGALPILQEAQAAFQDRDDLAGEMACLIHLFAFSHSLGEETVVAATLGRAFELEALGFAPAGPMARLGRVGLADFLGDYDGALALADQAATTGVPDEWAAVRSWMQADLLEITGHPERALEVLDRCHHDRHDQLREVLESARIQALWASGRVEEAVAASPSTLADDPGPDARRAAQAANALAARYAAYLGERDTAQTCLRHAASFGEPADRIIEHRLAVARAALAVLEGDDDEARQALTEVLGEDPGAAVLRSKMLRRVLPLVHVLVPAARSALDEAELGPRLREWRDLAGAIGALREGLGPSVVGHLGAVSADAVRSGLPLPWTAELLCALEAAGRPEGREMLTTSSRDARSFVDRIAAQAGPLQRGARRLLAEVPGRPEATVEIRLLGPAELHHDGPGGSHDVPEWRRDRVRQLAAHLVLTPTTTREAVVDALWPDLDAEAGANNLRATLSYLLRALQPDRKGKEASYFVAQRGRVLALAGQDCLRVDVWEFDQHLRDAEAAERAGAPSAAREAYRGAVALWRGPFLADTPAGWAEGEAERLRQRFTSAASRAAELALAAGEPDEAERLARIVLAVEPWSERAFRVLASIQLDRGDRAAAGATLEQAEAALADIGVDPEPATLMLRRRLRTGSSPAPTSSS